MRANILAKIKLAVASAAIGLAGVSAVVVGQPSTAYAAVDTKSVCEGISQAGGGCEADSVPLTTVIRLVIRILSLIAGVAAVIMIVIGGLKYITSGGDSSKVASAKTSILYAIVGLIIVALAQFIVRFVLKNATK